MTASTVWSLLEGPLVNIGLGLVLGIGGLALLSEYRRLFIEDPRAVMSAEVLLAIIARSGGPGYFAAFLLTGAVLCFALALASLLFNVSQFLPL